MPDIDGHPAKEELDRARELAQDWKNPWRLIDFLKEIWWNGETGIYHKPKGRLVTLHTWGWSGNEEIIEVLRRTHFWILYWRKNERGGHYMFEIKRIK